jgi:hypothetical protein
LVFDSKQLQKLHGRIDKESEQVAVFGELLVVLADDLDTAQRKVEKLTRWIMAMTAVLVFMTLVLVGGEVHRFWTGH